MKCPFCNGTKRHPLQDIRCYRCLGKGVLVNRIQIVNWRRHGADEDYCQTFVYAADDPNDGMQEIQKKVDPEFDWDDENYDAETEGDWEHVIYVNDNFEIHDGDILEHNGRKFWVSIMEVKP